MRTPHFWQLCLSANAIHPVTIHRLGLLYCCSQNAEGIEIQRSFSVRLFTFLLKVRVMLWTYLMVCPIKNESRPRSQKINHAQD